jgi:cytochrome c oxidase assembly protein subunit 11
MNASQKKANSKTVGFLLLATVFMFGFGYSLVPLYDVFCEITGLNGKTGRIVSTDVGRTVLSDDRLVEVEFVTSVSADLPWDFEPTVEKMFVRPGVETRADFIVKNNANYTVVGNAVPSVAPNAAARFFNKTECFCFTKQSLEPKQAVTMPVLFVVDPELPQEVQLLTLGYTFFESLDLASVD